MFKLKDVFKVAVVGAAGYFGGALGAKFGQGALGKRVGTALGRSLMSRGGGADMGTVSGQYIPRNINLSQFGMGTYQAGTARSTPIQQISTDPLRLRAEWDYRLREYMLLRRYMKSTTT